MAASSFIVKQGFHALPQFVWHTWWRRNACAWTRLLNLSSSGAASSRPTSASWGSCCSLSHRYWPRHAQWRQPAHQPRWAPSLPHQQAHPSSSASLWDQWGHTDSPVASLTCRVPSPPHPVADNMLRPRRAKPYRLVKTEASLIRILVWTVPLWEFRKSAQSFTQPTRNLIGGWKGVSSNQSWTWQEHH